MILEKQTLFLNLKLSLKSSMFPMVIIAKLVQIYLSLLRCNPANWFLNVAERESTKQVKEGDVGIQVLYRSNNTKNLATPNLDLQVTNIQWKNTYFLAILTANVSQSLQPNEIPPLDPLCWTPNTLTGCFIMSTCSTFC